MQAFQMCLIEFALVVIDEQMATKGKNPQPLVAPLSRVSVQLGRFDQLVNVLGGFESLPTFPRSLLG